MRSVTFSQIRRFEKSAGMRKQTTDRISFASFTAVNLYRLLERRQRKIAQLRWPKFLNKNELFWAN